MTHEQAEKRMRCIIEIVIPLIDNTALILKDCGLTKHHSTLGEVSQLMQSCLNTIDQIRDAKQA